MTRTKWMRIALLLLCVSLPYLKTSSDRASMPDYISALDTAALYYPARCAVDRMDPYDPRSVLRVIDAGGERLPLTKTQFGRAAVVAITVAVNLPTSLLLIAPLSLLPWHFALNLWMGTIWGLLAMAGFWVWDLAAGASVMAGWLSCWMVLNSVILFWFGNAAGIATPLCIIAACWILKDRYATAAVAALALSLALKPQIAGFVWLYFVLAGGTGRKRALQALAVTCVLGLAAVVWIAPFSPHWGQEMHRNVAATMVRGAVNDPGSFGATSRMYDSIISLQSAISLFRNDPRFYNPLSMLIGGGLILVWGITVLCKRTIHKESGQTLRDGALLALAAVSVLTMLPVYHRVHDTKLLLLTVPACAMLWAGGGARRWVALAVTAAAIFVTSDIPRIFEYGVTLNMAVTTATLSGRLTYLLLDPASVVLLMTGCFYLWVYIRYKPAAERVERAESSKGAVEAAAN